MNKPLFTGCIAALLLVTGCSDSKETEKAAGQTAPQQVEESAPVETAGGIYGVDDASLAQQQSADPHAGVMMGQEAAGTAHSGTVIESVDAAGYTYVKVDSNGDVYWIAGPKTPVKAGQSISYMEQMWMYDFESKTLGKTFDKVMFATTIVPAGAKTAAAGSGAPAVNAPETPVAKAEGGYSVAEVYAKSADLSGKRISVKGKVVKLSRGIMGKDWVHIQDGTGESGSNDLVVTSPSADVSEGTVVTATGVVKTDVDLGYGYKYAVLIEEASFSN